MVGFVVLERHKSGFRRQVAVQLVSIPVALFMYTLVLKPAKRFSDCEKFMISFERSDKGILAVLLRKTIKISSHERWRRTMISKKQSA